MLDGPRARGAFVLRCLLRGPWSIRIGDESPLAVLVMAGGSAWVCHDDTGPVLLGAGDVALIKGPEHYIVADRPDRPPQVFVDTEEVCRNAEGESLADSMLLGVRTWGNASEGDVAEGATAFVTACYDLQSQVTPQLLDLLPRLVVVPAEDRDTSLLAVLHAEVGREAPGQEVVLDRLLDLVLIEAIRSWFARPDSQAPRWWQAGSDPVVGPALRALQHNPAHPWTIATLARRVGVSRATLARRFTDLVGEPPMAFLTDWRLSLAADLLRTGDETLASVARRVGYGTPFSLSGAFKRRYGLSPQDFRRGQRPA